MTISADHAAADTTSADQASAAPAGNDLSETAKKFGISAEDYMLPARHQIQMVDPAGRLLPDSEQGTEPGHEYPLPGDGVAVGGEHPVAVGEAEGGGHLAGLLPVAGRVDGHAALTDQS